CLSLIFTAFFFSSRRRHTRFSRDWSSDVCSSDLLATAGYNAGPNRARRWQPEFQEIAADQYTESIPLLETRDYVKHVMTNATHYGILLGQGAQSVGKRMQLIPLRNIQ